MTKKEDRRTAYSKMVIKEALFELVKTKPLTKISVKEICELADINRCTFYAYYTDIYDLRDKITVDYEEKQAELIDFVKSKLFKNIANLPDMPYSDYYDICLYYFNLVKKNQQLCQFIYSQNSDKAMNTVLSKHFFSQTMTVIGDNLPEQLIAKYKLTYTFISGGTTAMIMTWLDNNCETPIELMAKQMSYYYYGIFNGHKISK